jgi:hypothetical protein
MSTAKITFKRVPLAVVKKIKKLQAKRKKNASRDPGTNEDKSISQAISGGLAGQLLRRT